MPAPETPPETTRARSVVSVLAGTGFGGAERVACTLVRLAQQDGVETSLEAAPGSRDGLAEFGLAAPTGEAALASWARAARRRVVGQRPALVHVHLATPSMLGCALRIVGTAPALFTFHLLPEHHWPLDRLSRLPSKLLLGLGLRLLPRCFVNTVSATDAQLLQTWVPRHKLHTIINAPPLANGAADARPTAWSGPGTRLLAVGRLVSQKGFDRLLTALASPTVQQLAWHLVVLGDGPERERLTHLTAQLGLHGRVTWQGSARAPAWLRAADLVLSPSRYEGMPLVPLEAIREGAPLLASDIAPHRELLFRDAPQSLLPQTVGAWSDHLARYLADESQRQTLGAAQAALLPLCDPARQWREYRALYAHVLAET